ncbi:unnamed protein product [Spirodela intermedia]|uniref:Uncharacterized protein n=1 Tax=Spirodela intermedia TaxID=51605 RepID=A0A7I8JN75_SPIIN|nr:unnamed protein product [Spirodela intermedia]CAA6671627.1 unnamed protein product [Spirodela intermedia]
MSRLFREKGGQGDSTRATNGSSLPSASEDLPSPFGELGCSLSTAELRETAYEIFVAVSRTTGGKPLTYISQADRSPAGGTPEKSLSPSLSTVSPSSASPSLQRTLTATAASKMKKALGLNPSKPPKKPLTVGELVRVQLGVSEQMDARIRRGLLRVSAGQLGRRVESMVLPLELLQQFKASDFPDQEEYTSWQARNLKVLDMGLLLHPHVKLSRSDTASQRLRQIINGAYERPLETGKNSESMQVLRSAVMALAGRSSDGSISDKCHWADGIPLNLYLYQILLEACFDREEGSIIEEVDEVLDLIKKTWSILGIDQVLHNLCFTWALFHHFVITGQVDTDLLFAADNQLAEVAKDVKTNKDPIYSKILSSTLSSIMNWAEQRLLAYHDTFHAGNMDSMYSIVSLGVAAAKILVEDISHEYRRKRKEEVDVARSRVDAYIRSSLRTAFAQRMEQADSNRRSMKNHASPSQPLLCILAKDIGDLASKEKDLFTPILKKWHPLAAGVAVATLHACYANELRQFISGVAELTPDSVQVLKAADKLEKDLVQIAVEDSVESEDGGKAIIREMPPFEAESAIANLTRTWIKTRVDRLREWIDRNAQKEEWKPGANKENIAPSNLDAFFQLPIPMHPALLPDLLSGLDKSLHHYISKARSGCGTRNSFMPALPALTRCTIDAKLWKKKEKPQNPQRRSQVGTMNGNDSLSLARLCVRMNTLHHIRTELENLERKVITCLRNVESAQADVLNGLEIKFELCLAGCQEGIQHLCEVTAYKTAFRDLSHVLWDGLYVGEPTASRIEPVLKELNQTLELISSTVHDKLRNRVVTALMKATFDAFLLVLLAGGPSRAFSSQDSQVFEHDFRSLKDLYLADGDGLPEELVEKAAMQVRAMLPLFRADTENLIDRFRRTMAESYGPPTEPNTILRVLCYRNDEVASRYLKKTYGLPKKL